MFKSVTLYTNQLKKLQRFYMNIMELPLVKRSEKSFTVKVGESKLTFQETDVAAFYHFAFNIPGNQFSLIKSWIQNKIPLNREGGQNEVYFRNFDADSIYFEDPAGNVIELVGRRYRDLFGAPSPESFLNISEVSITTYDMTRVGDMIQDIGIPLWRSTEVNPHALNFLGREDTFIVLVPPGRKWYFSEQISEIHPLEISLTTGEVLSINSEGHLTITEEAED
ncbi:MAG TPA: hypothetical protein VK056_03870 [Bacillota bacterium]|nr:hypothetical protein [Bacillota bacterium]